MFKANNKALPNFVDATDTALTATASGTKLTAIVLTKGISRLAVVATAADSVLLPPAKVGINVLVINDGAAAAQVFGAGTDTIDGVATATGVVLTNAKRCIYSCYTDGAWVSLMGVKSA